MKRNHTNPDLMLKQAITAVRDDQPDAAAVQTATENVWQRISHAASTEVQAQSVDRIEGCADVLRLLPDYNAKRLAPARVLLLEDHLRECASCRVHARPDRDAGSVRPWRSGSILQPKHWSFGQYAFAASLILAAVLGIGIGRGGWFLAPSGPRATLQSVEGDLYRVDVSGEHRVNVGERFSEGELVRTAAGSRARLRLVDGSLVEMNGRSELAVAMSRRDTTIHLDRGIIIVEAAKRRTGHLYVATSDARVAVTGTIFSVNSGIKGSRVSVIEGTVRVAQSSGESVLHAGDQVSSSASLDEVAVRDEISWSENRDKYLALLAEFSKFQKSLQTIPLPDLRYESRLLKLVPDDSIVYAGVPNYGEALSQANALFQQQLSQSDVLREWWEKQGPGRAQSGPSFNENIEFLHSLTQFVGNEIVFSAGSGEYGPNGRVFAAAETVKPGLREFLISKMQNGGTDLKLHLLAPEDLGTAGGSDNELNVLIASQFVAASPSIATLREVNERWTQSAGTSAFVQSDFGQRIASEYKSGAGLLIAVNLAAITATQSGGKRHTSDSLAKAGFANVKYLIAERKDSGGKTSNSAELSFSGARQGIASWLGAPAPIGALKFISPNAAAVGAFVSKSPALMVDDLVQVASLENPNFASSFAEQERELNLDIRNDLAASLGGEAAFALDGALLPTPSWKVIVEVYSRDRLQYSIGKLVDAVNREAAKHGSAGAVLESEQVNGRAFYTIRSLDPKIPFEVHYSYDEGYLIAAATQGLVQQAIHTQESGDNIALSDGFRALLPSDQHADVSGLVYQNLAPVIAPIAAQLSAAQLQSLETIVKNSEPSLMCAYGGENEIDIASNSKTLGFDLKMLTLSTLLEQVNSGTRKRVTP
jgi:hypothetical protein